MGKRELVVLLNLSSWCLVMVEGLFLAVPWGCLRFVIVEFPDHTHLLFLYLICNNTTILLSFDPFLYFVSTRSDLGIYFFMEDSHYPLLQLIHIYSNCRRSLKMC